MSILSDSLKELREPHKKTSNFRLWLDSLDDEDRKAALEAIHDENIKTYPLFEAFRNSGMRVSKDYFKKVREDIRSGSIKDEDIR